LLALLLGTLIGPERQWRQRAAGLRTNALVCFGAAAFVDLGSTVAPGTTQTIAYVVSGVGFLGGGAIMKDGDNELRLSRKADFLRLESDPSGSASAPAKGKARHPRWTPDLGTQ
jgi:putative Mg2+ transporter-C (MgtC) family protein